MIKYFRDTVMLSVLRDCLGACIGICGVLGYKVSPGVSNIHNFSAW